MFMKVLIINYRYFISGGPERYMFNVKALLEDHGHEVVPFSVKSVRNESSKYESYFAEPMGGQDVVYYRDSRKTVRFALDVISRLFYSFHVKRRLSRLLKDEKPDVAYILHHYNKLSPSVISACKKHDVRVVMRLSDFFLFCPQAHFLRNGKICEDCHTKNLFACVVNKCIQNSRVGSALKSFALYFHKKILKIYDKVDVYVCTTNFMKKKLLDDGVPDRKVQVVPTFTDAAGEMPMNTSDGGYILYFGRFAYEKGVDMLINAYHQSHLSEAGIKLVLIGGRMSDICGVDNEVLDALSKSIVWYEFLPTDQLEPLIRDCMFTVTPSRWYENLPNTILESYKFYKPVIASNVGSLPETVEHGVTGLLYEYENVSDLSDNLKWLATNQEGRRKMSQEIKRRATVYSRNSHYKALVEVLNG